MPIALDGNFIERGAPIIDAIGAFPPHREREELRFGVPDHARAGETGRTWQNAPSIRHFMRHIRAKKM
ncbi:hypothetical protein SAMN05880590_11011 [Rhizobium sp. RU35A]|nr:hypothetical protein SAMN05880590_11011 [Rhizobium sp. RU35A]